MLTNSLRSWIYNKIQGHYRRELYFQGLDISFYFSIFKFCLSQSNDFQELDSYELRNKPNLRATLREDCNNSSAPASFIRARQRVNELESITNLC